MKINAQDYGTERAMREYIAACESGFESQLEAAAALVKGSARARTVTLSGPSCSGKTTTARKLIEMLGSGGIRAHVVSIDDFYRNRNDAAMKRCASGELKPDYETIASIDMDAFSEFSERLSRGGRISVPVYDFNTGERGGSREINIEMGDVVLLEGIQAIYPEIVGTLDPEQNVSIHISVGDALETGGHVFPPDMIRLMRRIVRDYYYRSASPELTFYLWDEVRENEILNIEPYVQKCDALIDSLLPYEIGVLAPYLCRITGEVECDSRYAEAAKSISGALDGIVPIPLEYVPQGSVFREFLN